jgi:hypothetical protein
MKGIGSTVAATAPRRIARLDVLVPKGDVFVISGLQNEGRRSLRLGGARGGGQ